MTDEIIKPPEVIMVNKNIFIACVRALGVFLDTASENFESFRRSEHISPDNKRLILNIIQHDLKSIGQITHALEASMDFKISPDESKGLLN